MALNEKEEILDCVHDKPDSSESDVWVVSPECKRVTVSVTRDNWEKTDEPVVRVCIDASFDGGQKWVSDWLGCESHGGEWIRRDGSVGTETTVSSNIPDAGSTLRRLRVRIESKAALSTKVSISESDKEEFPLGRL